MSNLGVLEAYPEIVRAVGLGKVETYLEKIHRRNAMSLSEYGEFAERSIVVRELAGRAFRMMMDAPNDGDPSQVILLGGEFGNGIKSPAGDYNGAWLRGLAIRDVVAPEATLVYVPNNTHNEDNVNLSPAEMRRVFKGSTLPLTDRIKTVIGDEASTVMGVGLSQGAVVVGDYMIDRGVDGGFVALEAPNVSDRSAVELAKDFVGSGEHLKDNLAFNSPDGKLADLTRQHIESIRPYPTVLFGLGIVRPSNLALSGIMRTSGFADQIDKILELGNGVVHMWTAGDDVSPKTGNQNIAVTHSGQTLRYRAIEFTGTLADHSSTNVHLLTAAGLAKALELSRQTRA